MNNPGLGQRLPAVDGAQCLTWKWASGTFQSGSHPLLVSPLRTPVWFRLEIRHRYFLLLGSPWVQPTLLVAQRECPSTCDEDCHLECVLAVVCHGGVHCAAGHNSGQTVRHLRQSPQSASSIPFFSAHRLLFVEDLSIFGFKQIL